MDHRDCIKQLIIRETGAPYRPASVVEAELAGWGLRLLSMKNGRCVDPYGLKTEDIQPAIDWLSGKTLETDRPEWASTDIALAMRTALEMSRDADARSLAAAHPLPDIFNGMIGAMAAMAYEIRKLKTSSGKESA